ncbi:hypothetical protein ACIA6C_14410 [Streptomyces sp. NPDC051578]|uniref:hypothetical protein n=1 Tax=Streptomyces sp. NPDC051578 TaxID=3365662 RepID=UPI00378FEF2D
MGGLSQEVVEGGWQAEGGEPVTGPDTPQQCFQFQCQVVVLTAHPVGSPCLAGAGRSESHEGIPGQQFAEFGEAPGQLGVPLTQVGDWTPTPVPLALQQRRADPAPRRAAYPALLRIAAEAPDRPTWSGDRIHAVTVRLKRDHHLDLPALWSHLWLVLPEATRAEITSAEQALTRATTLAGWILLYAPLTVWWWPAAPLAVVLALTCRHRMRSAADSYARFLEAAAQLHTTELAPQLGIGHTGPLDSALGDALTHQLRTRTPSPTGTASRAV